MRGRRWALGVLLSILLVGFGVALRLAWPVLFPEVTTHLPLDPACDLRSAPCTTRLPGGGAVTLELRPRSLPLMQPLTLVVRVDGLAPRGVEVDLVGVGMNMGFNRRRLRRVAPGRWQGTAILSACVRREMEWEARVLLHGAGVTLSVPYRFETRRGP